MLILNPILQITAIILWIALGFGAALVWWLITELKRSRNFTYFYDSLLDLPCWEKESLKKYRIVAVSHKGSLAIREWSDDSGHNAVWVNHRNVPKKLTFDEPKGEEVCQ